MIREARPADIPAIVRLVTELAEYERAAHEVRLDEHKLTSALFGEVPAARCHVAEMDGSVVGMALYYPTFSTWTGVPGIWLEDLYVQPQWRKLGLGRDLIRSLARVAVQSGYERLEWAVLDWNTPAWRFYASLGARPLEDWTMHRVSGPELIELGAFDGD